MPLVRPEPQQKRKATIVVVATKTRTNMAEMFANALEYTLHCRAIVCSVQERPRDVYPRTEDAAPEPACVIYDYDAPEHSEAADRRMFRARDTWKHAFGSSAFIAITQKMPEDTLPQRGVWEVTPRFTTTQYDELLEYLRGLFQMHTPKE